MDLEDDDTLQQLPFVSAEHHNSITVSTSITCCPDPIKLDELSYSLQSLLDTDFSLATFQAPWHNCRNSFDTEHFVIALKFCLHIPLHRKAVKYQFKQGHVDIYGDHYFQ
eukprot:11268178-Ditylum_brightwellii.AAC.1